MSRLSLNQQTINRASLAEAIAATRTAGIESIGVWREATLAVGLTEAGRLLKASGLRMSSYCRGVYLSAAGEGQAEALRENRLAIEEAAFLAERGADGTSPTLVLVAGGLPAGDRDIDAARSRVRDVLEQLAPFALRHGVRLALEALHPMYAADRSVVCTLDDALDMVSAIPAETAGVVVDAFHLWWDPRRARDIARAGREGRIASYQVCDWITPVPAELLLARGMMGDGHVDFARLTEEVARAGYSGDIEVEVFNRAVWDAPFDEVARISRQRYEALVEPHLSR